MGGGSPTSTWSTTTPCAFTAPPGTSRFRPPNPASRDFLPRIALQLPARGVDIQTPWFAHETGKTAPDDGLEGGHSLRRRRGIRNSRTRIQRDQIHLGVQVGQQFHHAPRV